MSPLHAGSLDELAVLLDSPDEETRRQGVLALTRHPFVEVRHLIYRALGDESWRVRKEAVAALLAVDFGHDLLEELIDLLRSGDNAGLRNSAVEVLTKLGPAAVAALMAHAHDPDHDVRKFVLDILGDIGDATCVPMVIEALADPDANVSAAAAENLGKIGDPRGVPPLVAALPTADNWRQFTILEALGRIGRPVPMAVIAPLVEQNLLKKAIYDCLGTVSGSEALPILVDGLKVRIKAAREAAAVALVRLRERLGEGAAAVDAALRALHGSPYLDGLAPLVESSDPLVREAVIKVLGVISDERSAAALLRGCRDDRLRRLCLRAFRGLGLGGARALLPLYASGDDVDRSIIIWLWSEFGFREGGSELAAALRDESASLRCVAVQAVGKIGLPELLAEVAARLTDREQVVRDAAIEALARLARLEREAVLAIAVELGGSNEAESRRDAAVLFGALGDAERLSLLIKDEDAEVRKGAIDALANLRLPLSVPHVVLALVDEDPDVRIVAIDALGAIGGEEVVEPLNLALRDDDAWVRCAAIRGLAAVGGERSCQALTAMLDDDAGLVVIAALEALAGQDQRELAVPVLLEALEHPDEEVVKTAIRLLANSGSDWLESCRELLLEHPHWDVRRAYIEELALAHGAAAIPYLRDAFEREQDELVKGLIKDLLGRLQ